MIGYPTPSRKQEIFSQTMVDFGYPEHSTPGYRIKSHVHPDYLDKEKKNQIRYNLPSQLLVISAVIVLLGDILAFWVPEIFEFINPENSIIFNSIGNWILMGWNLMVIIFAFLASSSKKEVPKTFVEIVFAGILFTLLISETAAK